MPGADSCPHCDVVADVEPNAALGFRCLVCGGPRVVVDAPDVKLSATARAALKGARSAHTRHLLLTAVGVSLGGLGGLGLLVAGVALLAVAPGALLSALTLLACGVPLAAGAWALLRAAGLRKLRAESLHAARLAALVDAQAALGTLDAARVSELMRVDAESAELLLAEASVSDLLERAAPRLRVDAAPERTQLAEAPSEPLEAEAAVARQRTES